MTKELEDRKIIQLCSICGSDKKIAILDLDDLVCKKCRDELKIKTFKRLLY